MSMRLRFVALWLAIVAAAPATAAAQQAAALPARVGQRPRPAPGSARLCRR